MQIKQNQENRLLYRVGQKIEHIKNDDIERRILAC